MGAWDSCDVCVRTPVCVLSGMREVEEWKEVWKKS